MSHIIRFSHTFFLHISSHVVRQITAQVIDSGTIASSWTITKGNLTRCRSRRSRLRCLPPRQSPCRNVKPKNIYRRTISFLKTSQETFKRLIAKFAKYFYQNLKIRHHRDIVRESMASSYQQLKKGHISIKMHF